MMNRLRPSTQTSQSLQPPSQLGLGKVESLTGRAKVTLAPGHSLMDWIRLGREKGDLSGVGAKKREVTLSELATHNTERDMWMAIRGKVYNMTPYLDFHPGGVEELMRAAGDDGTNLFDEVHNWVNSESMLTKCLIGSLVTSEPAMKGLPKAIRHRQSLASVHSRRVSDCPEPSYDWYQTNEEVVIIIYSRCPNLCSDFVIVDVNPSEVCIETLVKDSSFFIHFKPFGKVEDNHCTVNTTNEKAEIKLKKKQDKTQWSSLGAKLTLDKVFIRTKYAEPKYRYWGVMSNIPVTHDTRLLALKPPPGTRMVVPLGYHLHVHHKVKGMELARSYTVILPSLLKEGQDNSNSSMNKVIHFMIKSYEGGAISPWITGLKAGDKVKLDRFDGNFLLQRVHSATHLIMFAAGTGFTSMIRLIYHALWEMSESSNHLHLVFYNKTPEDIIWREQLDDLQKKFKDRFSVTHCLSRATDSWKGMTGRVKFEHVQQFVPEPSVDANPLLCICGMHAFNESVEGFAKQIGLLDNHIHIFTQTT